MYVKYEGKSKVDYESWMFTASRTREGKASCAVKVRFVKFPTGVMQNVWEYAKEPGEDHFEYLGYKDEFRVVGWEHDENAWKGWMTNLTKEYLIDTEYAMDHY